MSLKDKQILPQLVISFKDLMNSRCKLAGLLTSAQVEMLKTLFDLQLQMGSDRLWRPKDLGAYRSSPHALTLKRLLERGLVARAPIGDATLKPNFGYKITEEGCQAWLLFKDMAAIPLTSLYGGPPVVRRVSQMALLAQ